jgi:hypothetical protein
MGELQKAQYLPNCQSAMRANCKKQDIGELQRDLSKLQRD